MLRGTRDCNLDEVLAVSKVEDMQRKAVEAGRLAHRAGRIPERLYAEASTSPDGLADLGRPAKTRVNGGRGRR